MIKPNRVLSMDTETNGLNFFKGAKPYVVSATDIAENKYYWEWEVNPKTREPIIPKREIKQVRELIDEYDLITFHNAKFDVRALSTIGIDLTQSWEKVFCTVNASHVADSSEDHDLKTLSLKYLDMHMEDQKEYQAACVKARRIAPKNWYRAEHVDPKGFSPLWDGWMIPLVCPDEAYTLNNYAMRDALRGMRLYCLYYSLFTDDDFKNRVPLLERETRLIQVLYNMEEAGLTVKKASLDRELERFEKIVTKTEKQLISAASRKGMKDFNVRSSPQLQKMLYDKLNCPVIAVTAISEAPATDADTINDLILVEENSRKPNRVRLLFLNNLQVYRENNTAFSYLKQYEEASVRGGIHTTLNQTGTRTTRLSSSHPNQQNVKKGNEEEGEVTLRKVFGPATGWFWWDADYSNLEMRLFAYDSGEEELIEAFLRGESVHMVIARALHGNRITKESKEYKYTKNGNFSLIYGASENRADNTYHLNGAYRKIRKRFKNVDAYMDKYKSLAQSQGYIDTMFGYRLMVDPRYPHKATNYRIQGTAGDILKEAMLNVHDYIEEQGLADDVRMVMTVHDELITEARRDLLGTKKGRRILNGIREAMEEPGYRIKIPTPVEVDLVTRHWGERKELVKVA